MSRHVSLYLLLLLAAVAWGALLLYTRYIPPATVMAFVAFFLLLSIALVCTLTPIVYFIGLRLFPKRLYYATQRHALRQGILLSLIVVLNILLSTLNSWNIFTAIIILAVAIVVEVLSLARK